MTLPVGYVKTSSDRAGRHRVCPNRRLRKRQLYTYMCRLQNRDEKINTRPKQEKDWVLIEGLACGKTEHEMRETKSKQEGRERKSQRKRKTVKKRARNDNETKKIEWLPFHNCVNLSLSIRVHLHPSNDTVRGLSSAGCCEQGAQEHGSMPLKSAIVFVTLRNVLFLK